MRSCPAVRCGHPSGPTEPATQTSKALGGFLRQPYPGKVDLPDPIFHAMACQAKGIPTESIGFNNLRTCLQVFMMEFTNQVRLRDVQFVIATIDEDSLGVEQGPGGAIAQDRGLLQTS